MLVCPTSPDLDLSDGLALTVSEAGGSEFSEKCERYVDFNGRLKVSEGVFSVHSATFVFCSCVTDVFLVLVLGVPLASQCKVSLKTRFRGQYRQQHGGILLSQITEVGHVEATGKLKCRFVLFVVPPLCRAEMDPEECVHALTNTYTNVLDYVNDRLKSSSVVLPELGTGPEERFGCGICFHFTVHTCVFMKIFTKVLCKVCSFV